MNVEAQESSNSAHDAYLLASAIPASVELHMGLETRPGDPNRLRIRDNHVNDVGACLEQTKCPATVSDSPESTAIAKDNWSTLTFDTNFVNATFTDGTTIATHVGWDFGPLQSIVIQLGFQNSSTNPQQANFDDLVCTLGC